MGEASSRSIGAKLAEDLRAAALEQGPVKGDGGLDDRLARALEAKFGKLPVAPRQGIAAENGRSDTEYWRDHGRLTAELMQRLAEEYGGHAELYARVGRLHDVDYLAFPHDAGETGPRHPVPLVQALSSADVHPAICLAVLEHAPYVGLGAQPSSRLSAALSAAEDLATLAALDPRSPAIADLSPSGQRLLGAARPRVFFRRASGVPVRVETNVESYVNSPLKLLSGRFDFEV